MRVAVACSSETKKSVSGPVAALRTSTQRTCGNLTDDGRQPDANDTVIRAVDRRLEPAAFRAQTQRDQRQSWEEVKVTQLLICVLSLCCKRLKRTSNFDPNGIPSFRGRQRKLIAAHSSTFTFPLSFCVRKMTYPMWISDASTYVTSRVHLKLEIPVLHFWVWDDIVLMPYDRSFECYLFS